MVVVGSAGYVVSFFLDTVSWSSAWLSTKLNAQVLDQPNITSAVAAFTVGYVFPFCRTAGTAGTDV
jgi:hypothetical protein